MYIADMKVCSKCGAEKSKLDFNKRANRKGGLSPYCKDCNRDRCRDYYNKNRNKIKERKLEDIEKARANARAIVKRFVINHPERVRESHKKQIRQLNEGYLRSELKRKGWPKESITEDLIKIYRMMVQYWRIKNNKNYVKQNNKP